MYRNSQRKVPLKPLLEKGVTPFYFPPLFSFFLRFGQRLSDSLIQGTRRDDCRTNEIVPLRPKLWLITLFLCPFPKTAAVAMASPTAKVPCRRRPFSSIFVYSAACKWDREEGREGTGTGGPLDTLPPHFLFGSDGVNGGDAHTCEKI